MHPSKRGEVHALWRRHINPGYVDLLETFDFGRLFVRAEGWKLWDAEGREYLDLLAGFGVHSVGHNHPRVLGRLREVLDAAPPSMLNVDAPPGPARLAEKLCAATHPELGRAAFANSGAEAVEIALKTARAATGREAVVACDGAYHGLTTGALSLAGEERLRRPFGKLLPSVAHIPFGDDRALERACAGLRPAAFFVEPIQGEGGVRIPPDGYLGRAGKICRRHGCLLVVDEIQTGLGRTGRLFATSFDEVVPDVLLVGKALSGGLVPVAAAMVRAPVWDRAYPGPGRSTLNASTFAGGALASAVGLAVLEVIEEEGLCERARQTGAYVLDALRRLAERRPMIAEVRGRGLFAGIEFRPASGLLFKAVPEWAREGLYAQVLSALLLRDHGILTQPCGVRGNVLRVEPPLALPREEVDRFARALDDAMESCPSQASALLSAFRKAVLGGEL
jgi:acetylornithine/succinyldiaminopimelate/putrescine aminotransferase